MVFESLRDAGRRAGARAAPSARGAVAGPRRDPERTRELILTAAEAEFAAKGLGGARVDQIARRAGANKRMIYHYFGDKDGLYLAVLERVYGARRGSEAKLELGHLEPEAAIRALVQFNFAYCREHPAFISIVNNENLHGAAHLRRSRRVRDLHSPLIASIERILREGARRGTFRRGVDPVQLYVSIAALNYFYFSNNATLSVIFGRDLADPKAVAARERHVVEVVLGFLRR